MQPGQRLAGTRKLPPAASRSPAFRKRKPVRTPLCAPLCWSWRGPRRRPPQHQFPRLSSGVSAPPTVAGAMDGWATARDPQTPLPVPSLLLGPPAAPVRGCCGHEALRQGQGQRQPSPLPPQQEVPAEVTAAEVTAAEPIPRHAAGFSPRPDITHSLHPDLTLGRPGSGPFSSWGTCPSCHRWGSPIG